MKLAIPSDSVCSAMRDLRGTGLLIWRGPACPNRFASENIYAGVPHIDGDLHILDVLELVACVRERGVCR